MSESSSNELLKWLDEQIKDAKHHHKRDTNPRHDAITLGKIRAYNSVRIELVGEAHSEQ